MKRKESSAYTFTLSVCLPVCLYTFAFISSFFFHFHFVSRMQISSVFVFAWACLFSFCAASRLSISEPVSQNVRQSTDQPLTVIRQSGLSLSHHQSSYSINQRTYFPGTQTVNHHQNQPIYSLNQSVVQFFICIFFFTCWFKIFPSLMLVILISNSLNYTVPLHFFQYTFISLTSRLYIS